MTATNPIDSTDAYPDLDALEALFRSRRSSVVCEREREIPAGLLQRLLASMSSAPNHRRTVPWRLALFTGAGRVALGDALAADRIAAAAPEQLDEAVIHKTRTKYGRAPAVVLVGCAASDDPIRHREDLFACAAGIEHLLLAATAAGLVSLWSSPPVLYGEQTSRLAGFDPTTSFVGAVYLGHRREGSDPLPPRDPIDLPIAAITG
ncbi:MAG TPA: nitroreductase family protein [Ilumatobacteraceae bacterium]|nr:nitroreductase family protein [Ilumatobacteraceae bacterium]